MSKKYQFTANNFHFIFLPLTIKLNRSFNTAHSSTTQRTNFIITIIFNGIKGYGQCGLPPKKQGCYLADINDCFQFAYKLAQILKNNNNCQSKLLEQFQKGQIQYFKSYLEHSMKESFCFLLNSAQKITQPNYKAGKSAFQFAIFDLWSKIVKIKLSEGIFGQQIEKNRKIYGFYTISKQQNKQMIQNAMQGLKKTSYIKIKYDNKINQLIQLLRILKNKQIGQKWIIDLNCSWRPQQWHYFNKLISLPENQHLLNTILYIQQPFDIQISQFNQWEKIKKTSKIKIIADESFTNFEDIDKIIKVSHGVNIKNQKTGGVISTLKTAIECQQNGLQIMFGSMVSTQLGCSQSFHFYPIGKYFDIDGSLLIKQPVYEGGFKYGQKGQLVQIGGFDQIQLYI